MDKRYWIKNRIKTVFLSAFPLCASVVKFFVSLKEFNDVIVLAQRKRQGGTQREVNIPLSPPF
jgi:hypothetical protein